MPAFWFHFNKPESKKRGRNVLSVHYRGKCHMVESIECNVPVRTRDRNCQPRCVVAGDGVVSIEGTRAVITAGNACCQEPGVSLPTSADWEGVCAECGSPKKET